MIHCLFKGNTTGDFGGGMYSKSNCNPTLIGCTFQYNTSDASGAGIYIKDGNLALTDCIFEYNVASTYGGGVHTKESVVTLTNCYFNTNSCAKSGGGMNIYYYCTSTITECVFTNNSAGFGGGGLYINRFNSPILDNCTFTINTADSYGGGIYNDQFGNPKLSHCIIMNNIAGIDGGGISSIDNSIPELMNTIACDNSPDQIDGTWIDRGENCVSYDCDDCPKATLTISPDPLIAGDSATFSMTDGNPNERAYLVYSLTGIGETYVPVLNVTLSLDHPIRITDENGSWKMTNDAGFVQHVFDVPEKAAGLDIWFQVCQYELTTNVVETWIE